MSDEPAATTPIPVTIIAFNLSSRFLLALAFVFIFSSRFRAGVVLYWGKREG